jgi:hypothetical protein
MHVNALIEAQSAGCFVVLQSLVSRYFVLVLFVPFFVSRVLSSLWSIPDQTRPQSKHAANRFPNFGLGYFRMMQKKRNPFGRKAGVAVVISPSTSRWLLQSGQVVMKISPLLNVSPCSARLQRFRSSESTWLASWNLHMTIGSRSRDTRRISLCLERLHLGQRA